MNIVNLCGKIHKIKRFERVTYVTLHCKDGRNNEFLDVTIFNSTFFDRYFCEGMWIGICGHIHKNKDRDFKQEIIAENLMFVGDVPDTNGYQNIPNDTTAKQLFDIDQTTGEILNTQP